MSLYITEIIADIKQNPKTWTRNGSNGLKKEKIKISGCGNGTVLMLWITSVVEVNINGIDTWEHLTWLDKIGLEETFKWWMKKATLQMVSEQ